MQVVSMKYLKGVGRRCRCGARNSRGFRVCSHGFRVRPRETHMASTFAAWPADRPLSRSSVRALKRSQIWCHSLDDRAIWAIRLLQLHDLLSPLIPNSVCTCIVSAMNQDQNQTFSHAPEPQRLNERENHNSHMPEQQRENLWLTMHRNSHIPEQQRDDQNPQRDNQYSPHTPEQQRLHEREEERRGRQMTSPSERRERQRVNLSVGKPEFAVDPQPGPQGPELAHAHEPQLGHAIQLREDMPLRDNQGYPYPAGIYNAGQPGMYNTGYNPGMYNAGYMPQNLPLGYQAPMNYNPVHAGPSHHEYMQANMAGPSNYGHAQGNVAGPSNLNMGVAYGQRLPPRRNYLQEAESNTNRSHAQRVADRQNTRQSAREASVHREPHVGLASHRQLQEAAAHEELQRQRQSERQAQYEQQVFAHHELERQRELERQNAYQQEVAAHHEQERLRQLERQAQYEQQAAAYAEQQRLRQVEMQAQSQHNFRAHDELQLQRQIEHEEGELEYAEQQQHEAHGYQQQVDHYDP
ncbi:uncharacterized protein B0H18DRAFT_956918 [Fomitopsis serialis]|uniref:uncharacterized protein n=1 Tax=Fomitopsis serialis TaxID=139415 RepID=UPI0020088414|nr:uncharacterized protein B0H18DRAFT_956918 [Neoantrodia serialis]KAH9920787.1 hypothetical protein B0H18DRAFT_956918 [Neoantrodia serialis]